MMFKIINKETKMENDNIPKQPTRPKPRVSTAKKAFENMQFIYSKEGRAIRIISEYLFPQQYLKRHNINNTIVVFGSARSMSTEEWQEKADLLAMQRNEAKESGIDDDTLLLKENAIKKHNKLQALCGYYDDAVQLSEMICEWVQELPDDKKLHICTGGGPGMMEAANRGAFNTWSHTLGFNISLPFEQYPNQYISPDLNFEFHYFFMRKFWFVYHAKAVICMPGGFGTFDELMEMLTLEQTNIISKKVPIILYGEEFWKKTFNFDYMSELGLIDEADLKLFTFANTPLEALAQLQKGLDAFLENKF